MLLNAYEDWCEAVLLVDAENAFNCMNRQQALRTIKSVCPTFHRFLQNTYQDFSQLYLEDGSFILSKEGFTQGDNTAMASFGISSRPLIDEIASICEPGQLSQVWYADDNSDGGKLEKLRELLDILKERGPIYGFLW